MPATPHTVHTTLDDEERGAIRHRQHGPSGYRPNQDTTPRSENLRRPRRRGPGRLRQSRGQRRGGRRTLVGARDEHASASASSSAARSRRPGGSLPLAEPASGALAGDRSRDPREARSRYEVGQPLGATSGSTSPLRHRIESARSSRAVGHGHIIDEPRGRQNGGPALRPVQVHDGNDRAEQVQDRRSVRTSTKIEAAR